MWLPYRCRAGLGPGLPLLIFLALAAGLSSCSLSFGGGTLETQAVTLVLPGLPPPWGAAEGLMFRVEWRDGGGVRHTTLAAPGGSLEVELSRGAAQEVLAIPACWGSELRPAGARYPADLDPGTDGGLGPARLALGWKGGWMASLSRRLASGGYDPEAFNLARLEAILDGADLDPWLLEPGEAARRLVSGTFRSNLIPEPPRFAVALPGPGPWLAESALAPQPRPGDDGSWTVDLPVGISLVAGPDASLAIGVDASGKATIARLRRQ